MTAYHRPDDGIADAAEMVEVGPHRTMRRETAIAMGLWAPPAMIGRSGAAKYEMRAEPAEPIRADEVVGGFEGDCSATIHAEITLPGPVRVNHPGGPPQAYPEPAAALAASPVVPKRKLRSPKARRSLKEILADCRP